jgi:hypothetical protein
MPSTTALHPASLERLPGEPERPALRLLETPRRRAQRGAETGATPPVSRIGWWRWLRLGLNKGDLF